jgi:hypothetical protein
LQTGKGNLIKRAKDIELLGARPLKAAPRQLIGENDSEDEGEEKNKAEPDSL